ncbi:MAG: class I SAM-dependent methyltransferase [Methanobacterium sp. ERen5]|nr:MAG: class I SAM-dependent methyltransferase [Methanobacterium sp. ERen5]
MPANDNRSSHRSEDYDLQIRDTIPYYESFHEETLNMVKTIRKEPKIWLDTGCGTGTLVKKAVQEFHNTSFILSDPSHEMLNLAGSKLSDLPIERLQLLEPCETSEITLDGDLKPDVITAIQAHHYLSKEERAKTTRVCYELLNDNGIYITFENIRPKTEEGIEVVKEYVKNFQLKRGRDEDTVRNFLKRFDVEYFPIKVEEHLALLEKTGFKVVEMFWMSYMQAGFYCIK